MLQSKFLKRVLNRCSLKSGNLLVPAMLMAAATFFSKILGMARDVLLANYYGTSHDLVAFLAASKIPLLLFEMILGGVVASAFIPIFNDLLEKKGKNEAFSFANSYINIVLLVTIAITAIGLFFSQGLIELLAPNLEVSAKNLAVELLHILFPMIIFAALAFSFVGILQSFGFFTIPAIMSALSNILLIAYILIFREQFGIHGLAVAMLLGWGVQILIQLPHLSQKCKFRYKLTFSHNGLKNAFWLAIPMLISTWVQPFYSIVNMNLASSIGGGIAIIEYANKLYLIIVGVFTFVVTNLIFPRISRSHSSNNMDESKNLIKTSLKLVALVIIPIMCIVAILSQPLIEIIYERGEFTHVNTISTAEPLFYYSFGMLAMAFCEILNKSLFAMKNSLVPMITSLISMALSIVCGQILLKYMGLGGIALSVSIATSVNMIINFVYMRKYNIVDIALVKHVAKLAVSAAVSCCCAYYLASLINGALMQIFLTTLAFLIVYLLIASLWIGKDELIGE